jgi:hypothetical protein
MTATRDDRGRFVSADVAAADRVLQAACDEAVRLLRGNCEYVDQPEDLLHNAAEIAALLLDRRAS